MTDRQTDRERREREREGEKYKGSSWKASAISIWSHFHFDFNFVFQSQSRCDTIRSINVKLESVHRPQTIALFAKKKKKSEKIPFSFPFLSVSFHFLGHLPKHTFISQPFLSLYLSNPIPITSDNIIRDRGETRDRWNDRWIDWDDVCRVCCTFEAHNRAIPYRTQAIPILHTYFALLTNSI